MTSENLLEYLYNRKLPQIYRDEDRKVGYPLKRYLESLISGGFYGSIKEIKDLMLLIDPETIPEKFFPYLYESFGLEYFPDIDVSYQRKFLMNIGELVKRRGTFSSVNFLIKVLTGLESILYYEDSEFEDKTLYIFLTARNLEQINNIETSLKVIKNFIKTQIPYFVNPFIESIIDTQVISSTSYSHSTIRSHKSYKIVSTRPDQSIAVKAKVVDDLLFTSEPTGEEVTPDVSDDLLVWQDVDVTVSDGLIAFGEITD